MYCAVTVKNTGESISELEANTLVDNTCLDCGPIFCTFHCELPKILTELDCDVSETARLVIELGLLPILLLLIVKFRSCTFPAASWIRGGEDIEETLVRLNEDVDEGKGETEGETLSPGEILSPG